MHSYSNSLLCKYLIGVHFFLNEWCSIIFFSLTVLCHVFYKYIPQNGIFEHLFIISIVDLSSSPQYNRIKFYDDIWTVTIVPIVMNSMKLVIPLHFIL